MALFKKTEVRKEGQALIDHTIDTFSTLADDLSQAVDQCEKENLAAEASIVGAEKEREDTISAAQIKCEAVKSVEQSGINSRNASVERAKRMKDNLLALLK